MKHISNWKFFTESNTNQNAILSEIVKGIGEDKISDISYGNALTPYVHFIYNGTPFSLSLTDRIGMSGEYSTISVIVEKDGVTDSLGYFKTNQIDVVVDIILNYN
jgi:hypothetical protein